MSKPLAIIMAMVLLVSAAPASCDPRWWQHDRIIRPSDAPRSHPSICLVSDAMGSTASTIVAAWEEPDPASGDQDVKLSISFDGGCSWCEPVNWVSTPVAETRPQVEAGLLPGFRLAIHVLYEREAQVFHASSVLDLAPGLEPCLALAGSAAPTGRSLSRLPLGADARPRIAKASRGGLELHAVWERAAAGGGLPTIEYAHDIVGDGSGWTTAIDLSALVRADGSKPDIAADALSASATSNAATVAFQHASGSIAMTRSIDSGATWSSPVFTLSGSPAATLPAVDSSSFGVLDSDVWNSVVWQAAASPHDISFDAAHWSGPSTRDLEFLVPGDVAASLPPDRPGIEPALSISPVRTPFGPSTALVYAFWTDAAGASGELVDRSGVLRTASSPPRDLDLRPFGPKRIAPFDPTLSTVEAFSNCTWDDDWPSFASPSCTLDARPAGSFGAREVASADASTGFVLGATFVSIHSDDRTGLAQLYFKRTDGQVAEPVVREARAVCQELLKARVDVSFAPVPECPASPFEPEFIDRYLLYYGSRDSQIPPAAARGPFLSRAVLPNSGDTLIQAVDLEPGERYDLWLIAEDEARNINPVNFDPRRGDNHSATGAQQASVVTPACSPAVALEACVFDGASCSSGGSDPTRPRPGDSIDVSLVFRNGGDFPATILAGTIVATNAIPIVPVSGDLASLAISLAPLETRAVLLRLRVDPAATCPGSVDISIADLSSDGGRVDYGVVACRSPFVPIDCSSSCLSCGDGLPGPGEECDDGNPLPCDGCRADCTVERCGDRIVDCLEDCDDGNTDPGDGCSPDCRIESCAVGFGRVSRLKAVKDGAAGADFLWDTDPPAPLYHLNSLALKGDLVDPRRSPGRALPACEATAPTTTCNDADALDRGRPLLFYQLLSACGASGAEEGPF